MHIDPREYSRRRAALIEGLQPGGIALLAAAPERVRSRDVHHAYRQDSDFFYLTGFAESRALLALVPGREEGEVVLFCQPKDPQKELWEGKLLGPEAAVESLGVDQAYPVGEIDKIVPELMAGRERIHYRIGLDADFDEKVMGWVRGAREQARHGGPAPGQFLLLDDLLHEMRLFKSEEEIRLMEEAARISAEGHRRIMQSCRPGIYEYELEAELLHTFLHHGSRAAAYGSIVGAGANACVLHYVSNDARVEDGDLVLVDAGCEYRYYAADITRTFPANGRFSAEQREIYQIVLQAQAAAIEAVQPGASCDAPQQAAVASIVDGLLQLGLLTGTADEIIETEAYKPFYMHRVGHWLGIDVHDVGSYKDGDDWRPFEPGMVTTIEPGIYIAPDCEDVAPRWRGIGVRIEDDVLVTSSGNRILSEGVPRGMEEIEALMAAA
ncbi:MAG: Xaa-Pro aminopeptidase [Gammaproteobacteria bacterium]|nr:Xaa-Pro aminopeptidase [Gammaproteobacteria bacterium]MYH47226.1 Xaa-Pro aminopeptidase [Gammaproteobacteria bacterium]MYL13048.1 Xaa-Pro aminopeptidase [Gammaproteobacteria bacterium]